jgi:DNA-binding GntR family transcriptional regulator
MASTDKEAALILKFIPESGTTEAQLARESGVASTSIQEAVQRLLSLGLIQMTGDTIMITPFAHKARSLFDIVP